MSTEIKIKNLSEGFQSLISNGRHSIVGDEPLSSKGTDLGFSPPELILSGIGMCKAATVRYIARMKGWEIGEVQVFLSQEVQKDNGLKTVITVKIAIEGPISKEQKKELLRQADNCYIHRMIMGNWDIQQAESL